MFQKWLSPDGTSGGGGGDGVQDPPNPNPNNPNPSSTGETAEQKLTAALKEAERWQNGYNGLQKTLAKKDLAIEDLTKKLGIKETEFSALQQTHTVLETEHQTVKDKLGEEELNLNDKTVKLQRAKIIMGQFPHLASWEADGQLPETPVDAKEADIVKLFTSFSEKLAAAAKINSHDAGGSPPPPSGGDGSGTGSAQEELRLANAAYSVGNDKEYKLHFDKYIELSKQKGK
jgi:hypothetical protein